jgi:hypothetical protein
MRAVGIIAVVILAAGTSMAFAQASSMYDQQYPGPTNQFGQPALVMPPQQAPAQQAPPQPTGGLVFGAANGLWQVGDYLWSYMPAPVRGVDSPYVVPQGSGQVMTNFVPGTR